MPETIENKQETPESKEDIIDLLKEYFSTRIELARLSLIERVTIIFANLITDSFVVISMLLTFLFGSVTLALFLGEQLESYSAGFGIVALIYLALALLMYFLKDKYVEKYLINFMVKRIFRKKDRTEPEEHGKNI